MRSVGEGEVSDVIVEVGDFGFDSDDALDDDGMETSIGELLPGGIEVLRGKDGSEVSHYACLSG